jgi:methylmalonyl-CoA/ethylmalonyl-CoA epimerase
MIKKFDHVSMVVDDSQAMISLLSRLFGFEVTESHTQTEEGFKSTLVSKAELTFELIEPVGVSGPIHKFVEKRGGGLHHVSIQVTDLEKEMERLKALGVQFVGTDPSQVSDATKVVFIHPRSMNGLLIELIERK